MPLDAPESPPETLEAREIRRLLDDLEEVKFVLERKRGRLAVLDESISQMQQRRVQTRLECAELEQRILDGLVRVIALVVQQAEPPGRPNLIKLADLEREQEALTGVRS